MLEAVGAGAAGSWMWSNLGPRMLKGDHAPGFKIDHQLKDLRLALEAADAMGIALPGTQLVMRHFAQLRFAAAGNGDLGTQALIDAVRAAKG